MDSPITIRALVILVLDAGPAHGAELRARIAERTGGLVHPGEGAVHSAIASLGRDRLIEEASVEHHATGGRPRRFWQLTEAGRSADLEIRQTLATFCAVMLADPDLDVGAAEPGITRPAVADLAGLQT